MISSCFFQKSLKTVVSSLPHTWNTWKQSPARINAHSTSSSSSTTTSSNFRKLLSLVVFACDKDQTILVMVNDTVLLATEMEKINSLFFLCGERTIFLLPLTFCWWFFCLLLLCVPLDYSLSRFLLLSSSSSQTPSSTWQRSPFAPLRRRFSVMKLYLHILRSCLNIIVLLMSTLSLCVFLSL